MSINVGRMLDGPDDFGYDPEKWQPCDDVSDLVCGIESFLADVSNPGSHDVYARIRDDAHSRVVLSRLDVEDAQVDADT